MAKAKVKFDFKELLLKKGEHIALGVAGVSLVIMLIWGISAFAGAANSTEISKEFNTKAASIDSAIKNPNDTQEPPPLPEWAKLGKATPHDKVPVAEFELIGTLFDPTGRPDVKRENPTVFGIEEYQVDLVRGAMPGYDITYENDGKDALIAVRVSKKIDGQDKEKLKES
ncbi:MAG TPA: hypothetical protein VGL71_03015, partial [Urbifossiella sp.]